MPSLLSFKHDNLCQKASSTTLWKGANWSTTPLSCPRNTEERLQLYHSPCHKRWYGLWEKKFEFDRVGSDSSLSLPPPPPVLQICNLGETVKVNEPPPNTTSRCPSPKSRWVSLLPCLESPLLKTQSHSFLTCHDLNSRWPKIWPMTLGQRFDLKGSPYSTLVVNQNTVKFFFLHIHHTRVLTN